MNFTSCDIDLTAKYHYLRQYKCKLPDIENKEGAKIILDSSSMFLFDVDDSELSFKVHFPMPEGNMLKSLTLRRTFNICVVLASGEKSCIKFRNKTP